MKGEAIIIRVDGHLEVIPLDHTPTAEEIHEWVQGYIEMIPYFSRYNGKRCVAFCNEEGKLEGMQVNVIADALWQQQYATVDILVGPVVIITGDDELLGNL